MIKLPILYNILKNIYKCFFNTLSLITVSSIAARASKDGNNIVLLGKNILKNK